MYQRSQGVGDWIAKEKCSEGPGSEVLKLTGHTHKNRAEYLPQECLAWRLP